MRQKTLYSLLFTLIFIAFAIPSHYGQSSKKPLDHTVYESWKDIRNSIISPDGKWISYEIRPQQGDGFLYLVNIESGEKDSISRGTGQSFSFHSDFLVFKIKPQHLVIRQAKKDKKKKDEMPRDSLGIWIISSGEIMKFPDVQSYKVAPDGSSWMAFHHFEIPDTTDEKISKNDSIANEKPDSISRGSDLIIINPVTKKSHLYEHVTAYAMSLQGQAIGFVQENHDTIPVSTVSFFTTEPEDNREIFESIGRIQNITLDEPGTQMAFQHHQDTAKEVGLDVYYWNSYKQKTRKIVDTLTLGMPAEWGASRNGKIWFSGDGMKVYLGTAHKIIKEEEDTLLDEEKPKVDVWNWKDDLLQTQQKVQLKNEEKKTYLAVYHIEKERFIQLADTLVRTVRTLHKGNGDVALGLTSLPYDRQSSWDSERFMDVYIIDLNTGEKELILKKKSYNIQLSPHGKYLMWYETTDSSWYAHDIKEDKLISLTRDIPVNFYNEKFDMAFAPYPHGRAGWTDEDRFVLIYDRFDIWKIDVAGNNIPLNLTNEFGRKNEIRFRYQRIDRDEYFIDPGKPMFLHGLSEKTKETGFFQASALLSDDPVQMVYGKWYYSSPVKAKNAEKIIWRKGSFKVYPELYCSDVNIKDQRKISNTNPQAGEYLWGDAKLVHWISFDNEQLDGILYTPENLDPGKKYPMLVYFYEKRSSTLYQHSVPRPSSSTINIPYCVSNGYIVFVPDINYKIGYPGQSAYNAVVSGTMAMANTYPFINIDRMAIQGQSWGGYQVAYLITQTNLYAAAMSGAPVSNMTSAYGGIRWGSGKSRMFQYEESQSRIGGTLWERTNLYLENSPLFHVPKIETPVLIMHNDKDGAVPWYQGIEFFVALRRLDKPSWLLVYNDEQHNLTKWPNRIDLSIRMMQFFDHYLKDEPAPEWMEKGIPAIDKGKKDGFKLLE